MLYLLALLVIALLIAVNAMFVAAELGAVGVRHTRVEHLADEGSRLARRLAPIIGEPKALDRHIATCQVGITASSLVLGAFGHAALAIPLAGLLADSGVLGPTTAYPLATASVLIALTTGQMVLGELLPKAVALRFPEEAALHTVVPVRWAQRVLSGPIALLNGSGLLLLRALRVPHLRHRHVHSPEEIDLVLSESGAGGIFAPEELRRLHSALHLGTRTAERLMVPRDEIVAIPVDASADEVLRLIADSPYSRFPVYEGDLDRVVGILHTKDVVVGRIERGRVPPLRELLRPAATAPAGTGADRLLVMLRERRAQQAMVVGPGGRVLGLVTVEDALGELFGELSVGLARTGTRLSRAGEPRPREAP